MSTSSPSDWHESIAATPIDSCSFPARSGRWHGWPATRTRGAHPPRIGLRVRRRCSRIHLQAQPAWRYRDRSGRWSTCYVTPTPITRSSTSIPTATTRGSTARRDSIFPSALSPAAARPLSRVPHLGGQPRLRPSGRARGVPRRDTEGDRSRRGERHLSQPFPQGGTAARAARALSLARWVATPKPSRWRCSGCSISQTDGTRSRHRRTGRDAISTGPNCCGSLAGAWAAGAPVESHFQS